MEIFDFGFDFYYTYTSTYPYLMDVHLTILTTYTFICRSRSP